MMRWASLRKIHQTPPATTITMPRIHRMRLVCLTLIFISRDMPKLYLEVEAKAQDFVELYVLVPATLALGHDGIVEAQVQVDTCREVAANA